VTSIQRHFPTSGICSGFSSLIIKHKTQPLFSKFGTHFLIQFETYFIIRHTVVVQIFFFKDIFLMSRRTRMFGRGGMCVVVTMLALRVSTNKPQTTTDLDQCTNERHFFSVVVKLRVSTTTSPDYQNHCISKGLWRLCGTSNNIALIAAT